MSGKKWRYTVDPKAARYLAGDMEEVAAKLRRAAEAAGDYGIGSSEAEWLHTWHTTSGGKTEVGAYVLQDANEPDIEILDVASEGPEVGAPPDGSTHGG